MSGFHTLENATRQSAVTQLRHTPTTEGTFTTTKNNIISVSLMIVYKDGDVGIPGVVMPYGATPFEGSNSVYADRGASSKENLISGDYVTRIGSMQGCGLLTPVRTLNSFGKEEYLLLTSFFLLCQP